MKKLLSSEVKKENKNEKEKEKKKKLIQKGREYRKS